MTSKRNHPMKATILAVVAGSIMMLAVPPAKAARCVITINGPIGAILFGAGCQKTEIKITGGDGSKNPLTIFDGGVMRGPLVLEFDSPEESAGGPSLPPARCGP